MKIAIVGSRYFDDYYFILSVFINFIIDLDCDIEIVSGGCRGVDRCAEQVAECFNYPIKIFYPKDKNKKHSYLDRNTEIVNYADVILAFPSSNSKGTYDTIDKAKKANKDVFITYV